MDDTDEQSVDAADDAEDPRQRFRRLITSSSQEEEKSLEPALPPVSPREEIPSKPTEPLLEEGAEEKIPAVEPEIPPPGPEGAPGPDNLVEAPDSDSRVADKLLFPADGIEISWDWYGEDDEVQQPAQPAGPAPALSEDQPGPDLPEVEPASTNPEVPTIQKLNQPRSILQFPTIQKINQPRPFLKLRQRRSLLRMKHRYLAREIALKWVQKMRHVLPQSGLRPLYLPQDHRKAPKTPIDHLATGDQSIDRIGRFRLSIRTVCRFPGE
jgi:hypothetical protein